MKPYLLAAIGATLDLMVAAMLWVVGMTGSPPSWASWPSSATSSPSSSGGARAEGAAARSSRGGPQAAPARAYATGQSISVSSSSAGTEAGSLR